MSLDFPSASALDGIRFTAQIGVPGVVQGLFVKRPLPTRVGAALHGDELGYRLVQGLVRQHAPDPFWISVAREKTLLVHHPDDIRVVLDGSPDPFASDPDSKRKGMAAFQPDALTISRGDHWKARRAFAESVLDTGSPMHRLAPAMLAIAGEETDRLLRSNSITWDSLHAAFGRITRRVIFGDAAAEDVALTDELAALMSAGNRMPGKPASGYQDFVAHVGRYVNAAERDSLCSLVAEAPLSDGSDPAGQLVHWMFAMGDTLALNIFRCLAVLSTHPLQLAEVLAELDRVDSGSAAGVAGLDYLGGCLLEAMRLWPTTPLFGRVSVADVRFPTGALLPAGSPVLIYNVFNHRNRDRIAFADRFAPEEWVSGSAADDWSFNFFSHGPQGCPGVGMAMFLGQAVLARIVGSAVTALSGARLAPGSPLPYSLDVYGLTVRTATR